MTKQRIAAPIPFLPTLAVRQRCHRVRSFIGGASCLALPGVQLRKLLMDTPRSQVPAVLRCCALRDLAGLQVLDGRSF
jgi:hypothetical protein